MRAPNGLETVFCAPIVEAVAEREHPTRLLLATLLAVGACAKLNPSYDPTGQLQTDSPPGSTTSLEDTETSAGDGNVQGSSGEGPGPSGGTSDADASGDHWEGSSGAEQGSSEGGQGDSSDADATTGGDLPRWSSACIIDLGRSQEIQCSVDDATVLPHACSLGAWTFSDRTTCGVQWLMEVAVTYPPGEHVFGLVGAAAASYDAVGASVSASQCSDGLGVFDAAAAGTGTLRVWNDGPVLPELDEPPNTFYARPVESLCEVPDACCLPSDDSTSAACVEPELVDCIDAQNENCAEAYTLECLQIAVLNCGAHCPNLL